MTQQIIIADDHPLFRAAVAQAVRQAVGAVDLVEADSIDTLQRALDNDSDVDLILLDLNMPGAHGFSGLAFLRGQYPAIPVVIVSGTEDVPVMRRAMVSGAAGFIPKSSSLETITEAIRKVLGGDLFWPPGVETCLDTPPVSDAESRLGTLTPQQFRVLGMLSEDLLNKQIAYELKVSEATVKAHMTALFKKLGVRSRTQAVIAVKEMEQASGMAVSPLPPGEGQDEECYDGAD